MALNKTVKKYESYVKSAISDYNVAKSQYKHAKSVQSALETKLSKAKTTSEKNALKKKVEASRHTVKLTTTFISKTKAKYTKAKTNLAKVKRNSAAEKRKATVKLKSDMLAQMAKDKPGYMAAGRPFVIPKYPGTLHSYVFIDNTSESETTSTDITTNAMSPGQYVNHFTQNSPTQRQLDGKLGGALSSSDDDETGTGTEGLKKQLDMLKRWAENGTEIELHQGQRQSNSSILSSVVATFDAPRDNAVPVSVTIQDTKWAKGEIDNSSKGKTTTKKTNSTGKKTATKGTRTATKPHAGTYVTIKKGDTYWSYHVRYGTSVAKLKSWNGFPEKSLPIGKKCRVK